MKYFTDIHVPQRIRPNYSSCWNFINSVLLSWSTEIKTNSSGHFKLSVSMFTCLVLYTKLSAAPGRVLKPGLHQSAFSFMCHQQLTSNIQSDWQHPIFIIVSLFFVTHIGLTISTKDFYRLDWYSSVIQILSSKTSTRSATSNMLDMRRFESLFFWNRSISALLFQFGSLRTEKIVQIFKTITEYWCYCVEAISTHSIQKHL